MINMYIAGKFTAKERLQKERDRLQSRGYIRVTSTWLKQNEQVDSDATVEQHIDYAKGDLDDVRKAQVIIVDTFDESATGGREVELGLALGADKKFVRVGPVRNIFHNLADYAFEDWESLHQYLEDEYNYPTQLSMAEVMNA